MHCQQLIAACRKNRLPLNPSLHIQILDDFNFNSSNHKSPRPCRCLEACYQRLRGVLSVESGYADGQVPNPTYKQASGQVLG